ncbi:uncharacterized protein TNCV_4060191 [Trichonephila clavipes]|nr:uncharacterized protein TNCV_4060191 [Trichonephila clavipes]
MKTVFKLADKVAAFKAKLELWGRRVKRGIFDMFQTLAGILGETELEHSFFPVSARSSVFDFKRVRALLPNYKRPPNW